MRTRVIPSTEVFADRQQNVVQAGVRTVAKRLADTPYATSAVLPAHAFSGGDTKTWYHGLGRTPVRWSLEDVTGGAPAVYRTAWDDKTITIACLAGFAPTITIRVAVD